MTAFSENEDFVRYLVGLADGADRNRAPLAHLRRALSGEPRDLMRVYPLLLPRIPEAGVAQQAFVATACLFALHPTKSSSLATAKTLGSAMQQVSAKSQSDSVESRFRALLQCHAEELMDHLRGCVGLVRSYDIPLGWADILMALRWWGHEAQWGGGWGEVASGRLSQQVRWAQEYWGEAPGDRARSESESVET